MIRDRRIERQMDRQTQLTTSSAATLWLVADKYEMLQYISYSTICNFMCASRYQQ